MFQSIDHLSVTYGGWEERKIGEQEEEREGCQNVNMHVVNYNTCGLTA